MKALEIAASSDSVLITVSHALVPAPSPMFQGRTSLSGVRSRKIAPIEKKMNTAGHRDTRPSARPRHSSNAVSHMKVAMIAALSMPRRSDASLNAGS